MKDPKALEEQIEQVFEHICRENMQGIPILNAKLEVKALGFREHEGGVLGIIITPWLMNLILLPGDDDNWEALELGRKEPIQFPAGTYKFMVNEIEGIGKCKTHSLHSPMNEFHCQKQAIDRAEAFLKQLMTESTPTEEERVDEELLGRILRGEEAPEVNLDDFATIEPAQAENAVADGIEAAAVERKPMTRRALLRKLVAASDA